MNGWVGGWGTAIKQAIIHMSYIILAFGKELIVVGRLVVIHVNEMDEVADTMPSA